MAGLSKAIIFFQITNDFFSNKFQASITGCVFFYLFFLTYIENTPIVFCEFNNSKNNDNTNTNNNDDSNTNNNSIMQCELNVFIFSYKFVLLIWVFIVVYMDRG